MKNILLTSILLILFSIAGRTQQYERTEVAVANKFFNVLYRGLDNPVRITAENTPCHQLFVKASNSTITGDSCNFFIRPGLGNTTLVTTYRLENQDTIELNDYEFRVKNIPTPKAYFAGKTGINSTISWLDLNAGAGLIGKHENLEPNVKLRVFQFDFTAINSLGEKFTTTCFSPAVDNEVKRIIQLLDNGSYITFSNIKASGPNDIQWDLDNIELRLIK